MELGCSSKIAKHRTPPSQIALPQLLIPAASRANILRNTIGSYFGGTKFLDIIRGKVGDCAGEILECQWV